ncbi:alpha-glucan family phosphorylase [Dysgonomonas sp. GY617]|uniref:alpha-glucan family phosphorylase n=1 Tax=Dysgonomonas sp. GY617 TaxID=2780420 RepID=UPI00188433EC|nr:alpha-glucan family phosphorylase [Dysgonomonas sp. GY617]MBF0575230.1 alpha-glucan family phosphorylase [Dysgonomonas sp. GY617]
MQNEKLLTPDYLFEVSWEVCNKVGGIHTVIATKVPTLEKVLRKPHILIGPDVVKENETNPEFIEDSLLLKSWRARAANDGLRIRVGRWNIAERPIAILVDFTPFFSQKDDILSFMWEKYKLDSLSGQWDYIEPALFGYAAGKVIESYVKYHCSPSDKIIAQFHEWMTGTGLLYLKSAVPQIGCAFTTHATALGRCIAGNNLPLYDSLKTYNPDNIAHNFNVTAKQSLEKIAAQQADVFTTVSDITAKECEQFLGRSVDLVTPNGFQDFITNEAEFAQKQKDGRKRLITAAEAILAEPIDSNALLIGISGRYEYKNKGIDVFIEALGKLNKSDALNREIVGFILVPAGHHGPSKALLHNLQSKEAISPLANPYLTHDLNDENYDPVLNAVRQNELYNTKNDKVKIFFVPSYLNGNDGIFDVPYYDLLAGLDLSLFPSYYEPWGYTPLESVAFKVPTITTTLAGFGLWVKTHSEGERPGIAVINRTDTNDAEVIDRIEAHIIRHAKNSEADYQAAKQNALEISKIALWDNLITYYMQAYSTALDKVATRYTESDFIIEEPQNNYIPQMSQHTTPNWFNVIVHRNVPEKLHALEELANNLWWSWNQDAKDLFESLDPVAWKKVYYNPIVLLDNISLQRYQELENDDEFVAKLAAVYNHFQTYMNNKSDLSEASVAYFCMEYGLHTSLKIYSGGLGILAGDYLKEASDKGVRMTGIGLLYRYGYFTQRLSTSGEQENIYEAQLFDKIPVSAVRDEDGNWVTVKIALPGRDLHARVWKVNVGRVELFLMDTDIEDNLPEDRSVTHHLYGGDWENRLKQELLLGVGGIRVLQKIGRHFDVYHCNEGHAAFTGLERIHQLMVNRKLSFEEAREAIRSSSLFTTHTPVPAGHDAFDEGLLRKYISHYPDRFQITWEQVMALGRVHADNSYEKFSMSNLAVHLSQEVNGVSWLHGKVSQEMFKDMFPGYLAQESYISYVTNGVHYPTWAAPEWKTLHERVFGADFATHHYDKSCFSNIQDVEDKEIWDIRRKLRGAMIEHIKERITSNNELLYYTPREIVEIVERLDPNKLTFGFARRFATYKRAQLLFKNIDTLNEIVNHPTRPVQFIFAGKAHPADKAGQDLIKKIVEVSKYPQFLGKILFIENYDMELASKLVQGVDIWLNTPTRPMEASGTSGEKAVMNGVMHFSVLDGWWVEGYQKDAGWALPLEQVYENNDYQNELDAEIIYNTIENEIAPLYYQQNSEGIPSEWVQHVKNSIDKVASNFTMNRQLTDYEDRFYNKLSKRAHEIRENDYAMAKDIVTWKHKMSREWDGVEIISTKMPSVYKEPIVLGQEYEMEIRLTCGSLSAEDIGVELVITNDPTSKGEEFLIKHAFTCVSQDSSVATYRLKHTSEQAGTFNMGLRIFAKNDLLAHQQDSGLVKWM